MLLIEIASEPKIIPNEQAVEILKTAYMSGKNRNNKHARFVDTSRGMDYVLVQQPLSKLLVDKPGIVDNTVNTKRAEEEMMDLQNLPPIKIGGNGYVLDGGHRVYIAFKKGLKSIPALVKLDDYKKGKEKGVFS